LSPSGTSPVDHALRQALDDGGLAHARVADQGRVVLGAAGKDLHDAADLFVTSDDRVELALAGRGGQIAPVTLERLVSLFRILGGDALAAAHLSQGAQDGIFGETKLGQAFAFHAFGQRQQDMLGGDIVVLHAACVAFCGLQGIAGRTRKTYLRRAAVDLGTALQVVIDIAAQTGGAAGDLDHDGRDDPFGLLQQRQQQMPGLDILMAQFLSERLGLNNGFLSFLCIPVQIHVPSTPFYGGEFIVNTIPDQHYFLAATNLIVGNRKDIRERYEECKRSRS
jgi:hypothetical protein